MRRGPFQKCQARRKKKQHSFSSNQGSVLKFENFAVIRRMSDFSASLGIPLGAQASGHSLSATSQGITEGTAGSGRAARPGLVLQAPSMGPA